MNGKFSRASLCALLITSCTTSLSSNSVKMNDNQYTGGQQNQERLNLFSPIMPTAKGMRQFFEQTFNHPEYVDVLPNDFAHFIQCMLYAQRKHKTRTYAEHVFSLFKNKMKDCSYVNAVALSYMLDNLTPILTTYMHEAEERALTCWQTAIDKILYDAFLKQFALFKKEPLAFFHEISGSITDSLYDQEQILNDISIQDFRTAVFDFIDLGLSKLIWHPGDGVNTWKLIISMSDQLQRLAAGNILTDKQLADLYDTLVKRYSLFLELVSEELPLSFFDSIKQDLAAHSFDLLDCGELESCIESKRQRLARSLLQAEAKVRTATIAV